MKTIYAILTLLACCYAMTGKSYNVNAGLAEIDIKLKNKASVDNKYVNLLHVLKIPEDRETYGDFCDWGYFACDSWGDFTDLKPGFWIYVYPNWYIWEKLSAEDDLDPKANVNGKYSLLLYTINVPGDAETYGHYYDYGFWEGYAYAGFDNLSPGYWVYVAPNWYIWGDIHDQAVHT